MKRWVSAFVLSAAFAAQAHDPGLSSAQFQIASSEIRATLTLARADVEVLGGTNRLGDVLSESFTIRFETNRIPPTAGPVTVGDADAVCTLTFPLLAGPSFTIESGLPALLPRGHRQFVSVLNARGVVVVERLLDANNHTLEVSLLDANRARASHHGAFAQFLILGVEHIATGFDHLVFLLGLLLVSKNFRDVLKVITAFTVAHSITLALAALGVIRISPRIVEPLIALSIIYVGVENLFQRRLDRRWMLAFAFGLIHGCGFASALRESGLGSGAGGGIAVPLFSFNLGVELGQVTLAAIVLPLLWKFKAEKHSFAPRFVHVCSIFIAMAGLWWLAARTVFA
jgi:hydrogenase/urease accessory protein HupE